MSCWHCGRILIFNTRGGRFEPFYCNNKYFCPEFSEKNLQKTKIFVIYLSCSEACLVCWNSRKHLLTSIASEFVQPQKTKGQFAVGYNDVFFLSACANSYIGNYATHFRQHKKIMLTISKVYVVVAKCKKILTANPTQATSSIVSCYLYFYNWWTAERKLKA